MNEYTIAANTFTPRAVKPGGFNLGANFQACFVPSANEPTLGHIVADAGSAWYGYDVETNVWSASLTPAWPYSQQGGHTVFDYLTLTLYYQNYSSSYWYEVKF